jgi:hypothetical protein
MRALILAPLLFFWGCSSTEQDTPRIEIVDTSGQVVAFEESAEFGDVENREARVIVLSGIVERTAYSATLSKVFDAPHFTDFDTDFEGDAFWIGQVSVRDADDNVLWRDHTNTMFQLVEFLATVMEQTANLTLGTKAVYDFVKGQYPALTDFPLRVPVGIPGGVDVVLELPNAQGVRTEVFRMSIAEILEKQEAPTIPVEITTLYETGPPEDRLDIVILGDGYREVDKEAFGLDAKAIANRIIDTEPFKSHKGVINIRAVYTPSVERGAGYDCTGSPFLDAGCKNDLRDTVFGTTFVVTALIDRLDLNFSSSDRVAMPLEIAKIYDVASQANYDEIVLISNSRRPSGFAGLYVSVLTTYGGDRNLFADVAVHELGHSFGVLGDEYQVTGDPCLFDEPRVPLPANIAPFQEEGWKWDRWFAPNTPIPTPDHQRVAFPVGAFEGAYNCDYLYRPAYDCKMNGSEHLDFCPVCMEQMTRRFYSVIDVQANRPARVTREGANLRFESRMHAPDSLWKTTWLLDGEVLGEAPEWLLEPSQIKAESVLEAVVTETSGNLRVEDPRVRASTSWTLRAPK